MRKLALTMLFVFVLVELFSSSSSASETKSRIEQNLPSQIAEYYKAYNFVTSFSSESERTLLASYHTLNAIPKTLRSKRLERVYTLLQSIRGQVETIDRGIVVPQRSITKKRRCFKDSGGTICEVDVLQESPDVIPTGLIQVEAVRQCNDNVIAVEVTSYTIDTRTNVDLISQYEKSEKKIPSEEDILKMPGIRTVSIKAIHRWKFFGGNWLKQEADIVLLETATLEDPSRYCTATTEKR